MYTNGSKSGPRRSTHLNAAASSCGFCDAVEAEQTDICTAIHHRAAENTSNLSQEHMCESRCVAGSDRRTVISN